MIEALLYSITGLIVINAIAVLVALYLAVKSGKADEHRRQYWKMMLEKAQREVEKSKQYERTN